MSKSIYRGYDIETYPGGVVWVSKDGESRHFDNEAVACDWINDERKKANAVKGTPVPRRTTEA